MLTNQADSRGKTITSKWYQKPLDIHRTRTSHINYLTLTASGMELQLRGRVLAYSTQNSGSGPQHPQNELAKCACPLDVETACVVVLS